MGEMADSTLDSMSDDFFCSVCGEYLGEDSGYLEVCSFCGSC